jgi:UDP-N-acetylmuramate: L-alanyl-gamma-D-glutamyl-meso-diaminopimelate ligase
VDADYVLLASVFDSEKALEKGKTLDTRKLIEDIAKQDTPAFALANAAEIIEHLRPQLREGDVLAIMSNGGFDGIHEKLLAVLKTEGSRQKAEGRE